MKKKMNVQTLVTLGVLIAMEIILSRFLSISAWNIKIGFNFIPVAIAAITYGPIAGGIVGGLGDLVGAVVFPIGAYFPGFTLTAVLSGVVLGLFLHKKQTFIRLVCGVAINQLILGLFVNTLWISILYGSPYGALFVTRIFQSMVLIPVQIIVIGSITKVIRIYAGMRAAV